MVAHIRRFLQTPVTLPVTLVVGDMADWRRAGRGAPVIDGCHWADFTDLDAVLLRQYCPEVVLSPLYSPSFDVLDLAARLHQLAFAGRLRALALEMPDPLMIHDEVALRAPGIDFDLFVLDPKSVNGQPVPLRR